LAGLELPNLEFDGVMDLVTVEDAVEAFERYIADAGINSG